MSYRTRQREAVLAFFRNHADTGYTPAEVAGSISGVSKATVYRMVSHLSEDGWLMKVQGRGRSTAYQYSDPSTCPHHMHIVCMACGSTFHLGSSISDMLRQSVYDACGYEVLNASVLKGICPSCRGKGR